MVKKQKNTKVHIAKAEKIKIRPLLSLKFCYKCSTFEQII
jgi:hypothetical protein